MSVRRFWYWPWRRCPSPPPCRWSCRRPRPGSMWTCVASGRNGSSASRPRLTASWPRRACWTETCTAGHGEGSGRTWPCRRARRSTGRPFGRGSDWTESPPGTWSKKRNKTIITNKKKMETLYLVTTEMKRGVKMTDDCLKEFRMVCEICPWRVSFRLQSIV